MEHGHRRPQGRQGKRSGHWALGWGGCVLWLPVLWWLAIHSPAQSTLPLDHVSSHATLSLLSLALLDTCPTPSLVRQHPSTCLTAHFLCTGSGLPSHRSGAGTRTSKRSSERGSVQEAGYAYDEDNSSTDSDDVEDLGGLVRLRSHGLGLLPIGYAMPIFYWDGQFVPVLSS